MCSFVFFTQLTDSFAMPVEREKKKNKKHLKKIALSEVQI